MTESNRLPFAQRLKGAVALMRFGTLSPIKLGPNYLIPMGHQTTWDKMQEMQYYLDLPEVSAVINKKAWMFSRMNVRQVSKETGQDWKNYESMIKVLRHPNWFQSWIEFMRQDKIFREVWGEEIMYLKQNYARPITSAQGLFTLPINLIEVKTPDKRPFMFITEPDIEYLFKWGSDVYELEQENIIHLNDNRIDMQPGDYVRGMSNLQILKPALNNIRAAYEARNMLITSRGVMGIFSPEGKDVAGSIPMVEQDRKDIQDQYKNYGITLDKWMFLFSNKAVKFQPVSIDDPSKLGLFEEIEKDFERVCDAYGVAKEMFSSSTGTTYENQKWGERKTWENTIIPEADEWIGALNSVFDPDGKQGWKIIGTFDDVAVLQEKELERTASLNNLITALDKALAVGAITLIDYQTEIARYGIGPLA